MSYTNLVVSWESRSDQNVFGDFAYNTPLSIKARKEPHEEIIKTAEGKEELSKHIFYVDPSIEPNAVLIKDYDKLDGEKIVSTYQMCTLQNKVRMIRFITV